LEATTRAFPAFSFEISPKQAVLKFLFLFLLTNIFQAKTAPTRSIEQKINILENTQTKLNICLGSFK